MLRSGTDGRPGTPDGRAESIIGDVMAADVEDQLAVVRRRRQSLTQGRRFRRQHSNQVIRLECALQAAERHLAVLQQRQAAWLRDRTFDRNLVERVLLLATIADFRESSARGLQRVRSGVDVLHPGDGSAVAADEGAGGTAVGALTGYLRRQFPPVE